MITIGKPFVDIRGVYAYLKAHVDIPKEASSSWVGYSKTAPSGWRLHEDYPPECWEKDFYLYFRVDQQYQSGLCVDRGDAFVVAMLYYAMVTGSGHRKWI